MEWDGAVLLIVAGLTVAVHLSACDNKVSVRVGQAFMRVPCPATFAAGPMAPTRIAAVVRVLVLPTIFPIDEQRW